MMSNCARGNIIAATLAASAILSLLSSMSYLFIVPITNQFETAVSLSPTATVTNIHGSVTVDLIIDTDTAVNAFSGLLTFDPNKLHVEKIDYNTAMADLWVETPWYENGAGTINFTGGTTQPGGFSGRGALLSITFKAEEAGDAAIKIKSLQILKHDGLGTEAVVTRDIKSILSISDTTSIAEHTNIRSAVTVRNPDLRGDSDKDGRIGIMDVSIFLTQLATNNLQGDFDGDGRVSTTDLSILLSQ